MKEEKSDEENGTSTYKAIGLLFLALAFVLLFAAATLRGTDKSQLETRLVLIIVGAALTFSGAVTFWLGKYLFYRKTARANSLGF